MSEEFEGVAIVGMAGRFPGASEVDSLWSNLLGGVDSLTSFRDEELLAAGADPHQLRDPRYVRRWGALRDIEHFDASFFGMSRRDAELTDPQHRLFLECAWEALESAGHAAGRSAQRVGVYGGAGFNHYLLNQLAPDLRSLDIASFYRLFLASDKDFLCTRVAHALDLTGPAITLQTGCSTSLVAVSTAALHLLTHQCDLALAGGASLRVPQAIGYLAEEGGISSPDGVCRAFDHRASGAAWGSAVGVLALKRLADAVADGDFIWAVIKGFALNNDGAQKASFTAPSVAGQTAVIEGALAMAGFDPRSLGFVEAHGTGTPIGDPIEVTALTRAFRTGQGKADKGWCALGSVKTNLGHTDTAAGVTGLIKATLAIHHGIIPPTCHFERPNPALRLAESPFFVNTTPQPFPEGPRRAGVSSFGIGGTNAHVVLEEAPPRAPAAPLRSRVLLPLSARTPAALAQATTRLAAWLHQHPGAHLGEVARTLQEGRESFAFRQVIACHDHQEALAALAHPAGLPDDEPARAWAAGGPARWPAPGERRGLLPLPTYPFERQRYWATPAPATAKNRLASPSPATPPPAPGEGPPAREPHEPSAREPHELFVRAWREVHGQGTTIPDRPLVRRWPATDGSASAAARVVAEGLHELQARLREARPTPLVWVTEGAQSIAEGETPDPALAALLGLGRAHQNERSALALSLLDVDHLAETRDEDLRAALSLGAPLVALRRQRLFVPQLVPAPLASSLASALSSVTPSAPPPLPSSVPSARPPEGAVLITGGLGGVGLLLARRLVEKHGAKQLLLAGRRAPDEAQRAAIEGLRGQGAEVEVVQLDTGDHESLRRLLVGRRLRGVVHAAGIVDDATIEGMTGAQLARVLRPKVEGAWALHELAGELDFLVFCSSISGALGAPGQGNYAAANAYLDALAALRRAGGRPAVSIGWGPWEGVGMHARLAAPDRQRAARRGLEPTPPERALDLFDRCLRGGPAAPLVLPPAFVSAQQERPAAVSAQQERPAAVAARPAEPRSGPREERVRGLLDLLRGEVARVLGVASREEIPDAVPLVELGVDSLMAVELRSSLSTLIGAPVPAGLLFDQPGLAALAGVLAGLIGEPTTPAARPTAIRRLGEPSVSLFLIGGAVGGDDLYLQPLARELGPDLPCFALLYPDTSESPTEIVALADYFASQITAHQPEGPIAVGGHSLGGLIAYELALRLAEQRREVTELVLMDAPLVTSASAIPQGKLWEAPTLRDYLRELTALGWISPELAALGGSATSWAMLDQLFTSRLGAMRRYQPTRVFHGEATFLTPADPASGLSWCIEAWRRWCPALKVARTSGNHIAMVRAPHVQKTARLLRGVLRE